MAYCPQPARPATLALLALDARLALLARRSGEPMLSQIRFAWWRETLAAEPGSWPLGEPLLAALRSWEGHRPALVELVEAWDEMTAPAPLAQQTLIRLAQARSECFAALCMVIGIPHASLVAASRARAWAAADIAARLTLAEEKRRAGALLHDQDWQTGGLPRLLRPLAVLHGLAARDVGRGESAREGGLLAALAALRLGLLGR